MDYVNAPVGEGRKPSVAAEAAAGDPDDLRLRRRGDDRGRARHPRAEGQDRHLAPLPAARPGDRRSGADRDAAAEVVASCGLDVICHAAESFIARPYSEREQPESPGDRPPYQGATPISDIWSAKALEYGGRYLRDAVAGDDEARGWMMLAASLAGIGFGAAGVHIPHACAYPIAGLKHEHRPPGYPDDHGFIPHGQSVIVTSPGGVPLHVRGGAGAPSPRRRAARGTPAGRRGAGDAAGAAAGPDARRRRADGPARARLRRSRTSTRSSRAR